MRETPARVGFAYNLELANKVITLKVVIALARIELDGKEFNSKVTVKKRSRDGNKKQLKKERTKTKQQRNR